MTQSVVLADLGQLENKYTIGIGYIHKFYRDMGIYPILVVKISYKK